MAMPRKRPFQDEEKPYTYVWRTGDCVLYVGFGKGRRCIVSDAAARGRSAALAAHVLDVGVAAITVEVYAAETRDEAKALERKLIAELAPLHNVATGSGGWPGMHTEAGLERMRTARLGKHMSEEHRRATSKRMLGNKNLLGHQHTEETKALIADKNKGRKLTEEARRKISEAKQGERNPMFGKPSPRRGVTLSEETKQKLREAAHRRYHGSSC